MFDMKKKSLEFKSMPPYLLLAFASLGAGGSAQSRYDEAVAAATSSAIAAGEEPPVVISVSRIRGPVGIN